MKKKLSDMVFQRVSPPDHKATLSTEDLAHVLVKRLGLKRKASKAQHHDLLMQLLKYRKDNVPLDIAQISEILQISQSQTYEELRKWRTLGLIEFVKIPAGESFVKGYMLTGNTVNRLMDRAESSAKAFFRRTRRIAKDFDDLLMLEMARSSRDKAETVKETADDQEEDQGQEESEETEKEQEDNGSEQENQDESQPN